MEYLVTMTTRVPDGTPNAAVDEIRTREGGRAWELAREGHLLRLWRPPLQPGEWRTLGLFDAADRGELEDVLVSMPLRVWRTDDVLELAPHPDDPGQRNDQRGSSGEVGEGSDYFTTFTVTNSSGIPRVDARTSLEADRTRELARDGKLLRLWILPGGGQTLGLWRASDADEMKAMLVSLSLDARVGVETTQLAPHPNDPALS